ncbi:uncharacterized protein EV422DRAFT_413954 [Fimicolochytrium jonesii]|uniref:uncharacterized protein n=1 Tax=Fimicolochytrium jonesii TaxID=1396493 RepID=UPI0022FEF793|nr:uncharacterized protein EV422DRAFT_413954 [Fimicolochytrium jonesii]KAI8822026.1 hypothetical protein EV422DRAFT_413954 [Fimicolochytrium jonesii]
MESPPLCGCNLPAKLVPVHKTKSTYWGCPNQFERGKRKCHFYQEMQPPSDRRLQRQVGRQNESTPPPQSGGSSYNMPSNPPPAPRKAQPSRYIDPALCGGNTSSSYATAMGFGYSDSPTAWYSTQRGIQAGIGSSWNDSEGTEWGGYSSADDDFGGDEDTILSQAPSQAEEFYGVGAEAGNPGRAGSQVQAGTSGPQGKSTSMGRSAYDNGRVKKRTRDSPGTTSPSSQLPPSHPDNNPFAPAAPKSHTSGSTQKHPLPTPTPHEARPNAFTPQGPPPRFPQFHELDTPPATVDRKAPQKTSSLLSSPPSPTPFHCSQQTIFDSTDATPSSSATTTMSADNIHEYITHLEAENKRKDRLILALGKSKEFLQGQLKIVREEADRKAKFCDSCRKGM